MNDAIDTHASLDLYQWQLDSSSLVCVSVLSVSVSDNLLLLQLMVMTTMMIRLLMTLLLFG